MLNMVDHTKYSTRAQGRINDKNRKKKKKHDNYSLCVIILVNHSFALYDYNVLQGANITNMYMIIIMQTTVFT